MAKKLTLALTAIALATTMLYFSPHYAVYQMKQAAQRHDAQALNDYVDYPVLRQNLKTAINQKMQQTLNDSKSNDLLSVMAQGIANKFSEMMIDTMVTPEGLTALVNGSKPEPGASSTKKVNPENKPPEPTNPINYQYRNLHSFSVTTSDANGKPTASLIFQRYGLLSWKLNGIEF